MNRRDFGKLAVVGLGAAAITTAPTPAYAAEKVKGSGYKCKSVRGSDGKYYLMPIATVAVKPGSQIQFVYKGEGTDKKLRFDLVDAGTGAGTVDFPITVNGTPSAGLEASPETILFVDMDGEKPITVEQPGN